jgi:hypothetical protein
LCGKWNTALLTDIQHDCSLQDAVSRLHHAALLSHFGAGGPVLDAFSTYRVTIDYGNKICIFFQLYFFTPSLGHSVSPAMYSLARGNETDDLFIAKDLFVAAYGCGVRDIDGQFWYPRHDKDYGRCDAPPDKESDWAIFATRRYGTRSLEHFMKHRRKSK